ncbi:MAG: hypothetical protein ABW133_06660 [Polyangiaceae bacterium]
MKLRPKWSQIASGTGARRNSVRLLCAALVVGSCSDLDPNIGKVNTGVTENDAGEGDASDHDGPGASDMFFALNIRPLMNRAPAKGSPDPKGCKGCHYGTEANHTGLDLSGLDLSSLGALRMGGGSSARRIIVPGKPAESVLVQTLKGQYPYANRMPKNGPFWAEGEVQLVEDWIRAGAKGADDE